MRIPRALVLAAAVLALAAPAGARAQRDTIRLGGDGQPRDTISLGRPAEPTESDTASRPEVPARWSRPFAVEGSGEVAPRPPAREPVWLPADTVRARRVAARRASASADQLAADSSAEADASDSAEASDSVPPPARRAGSRTAARDSAASGRRATTRAARADTAATRRRSASDNDGDDETPPATRTTRRTSASRDSAASAARRTAARDTASTRRTSASRDTAATRRSTGARPRTHTVAARETLFGIARRYGVTSAQIRAVNPDLGETLEIGTVLRLPAGARAPASRADAAADERDRPAPRRTSADADSDAERPAARRPSADRDEAPRPAGRARRHTVAAGETLYGLARKFGVTVDAIRRANRLESDTLRPGQALTIPAAPSAQR